MKRIFALCVGLAVLATLLYSPRPASASCLPNPFTVQEERERAEVVFSGKVVSLQPVRTSTSPGSAVVFDVDRVWKGDVGESITLMQYITSVDYSFEEGQEYLVFAAREAVMGETRGLSAIPCGNTAPLSDAQADIKELGAGHPPAGSSQSPDSMPEVGGGGMVGGRLLTFTAPLLVLLLLSGLVLRRR